MGPLRALLYELKENYREQPAFLYVENGEIKSISYDKFLQDIASQSAHYRKLSQDRIGLWGYNSYRWVTAAIGILLAGKHCILFDANLENPELLALAKYGDTELIAVDPELSDEAEELAPISERRITAAGNGRKRQKKNRKRRTSCALHPAHPKAQKELLYHLRHFVPALGL